MKRPWFDGLVNVILSIFFTMMVYGLLTTYTSIQLTRFPGVLVGIYFALCLYLFPLVAPERRTEHLLVDAKVLSPLYYLLAPVIFFYRRWRAGQA